MEDFASIFSKYWTPVIKELWPQYEPIEVTYSIAIDSYSFQTAREPHSHLEYRLVRPEVLENQSLEALQSIPSGRRFADLIIVAEMDCWELTKSRRGSGGVVIENLQCDIYNPAYFEKSLGWLRRLRDLVPS